MSMVRKVAVLRRFGAVAQLGERQLCKLDVVGSIPISSTSFPDGRVELEGSVL